MLNIIFICKLLHVILQLHKSISFNLILKQVVLTLMLPLLPYDEVKEQSKIKIYKKLIHYYYLSYVTSVMKFYYKQTITHKTCGDILNESVFLEGRSIYKLKFQFKI